MKRPSFKCTLAINACAQELCILQIYEHTLHAFLSCCMCKTNFPKLTTWNLNQSIDYNYIRLIFNARVEIILLLCSQVQSVHTLIRNKGVSQTIVIVYRMLVHLLVYEKKNSNIILIPWFFISKYFGIKILKYKNC